MSLLGLPPGSLAPRPDAAPLHRRLLAQARFDAGLQLRHPEQVLLTVVLPALLLVGLALTDVPDLGPQPRADVLTPGVLALAVLSTAFTGQAIGTGFDRRYGVLRLLATTPLGRAGLVGGRGLAVLAVLVVQGVLLGLIALALGWRPGVLPVLASLPALVLGAATFTALGLLLAGTVRAEGVLAVANLGWVLLVVAGGVVVPPEHLGGWEPVARLLPSGALGDAVRAAFGVGDVPMAAALGVLAAWGIAATAAALRWFRWD